MKTTRKQIDTFLTGKTMAMAGVSRDPKKFGHVAYMDLKKKGFTVYPVNPSVSQIDGQTVYASLREVPDDVENVLIVTPKSQTLEVVREAVAKGMKNIWIQQMSQTPEALEFLKDKNVNLVARECILMWSDPVGGIHKFHRNLRTLFGLIRN